MILFSLVGYHIIPFFEHKHILVKVIKYGWFFPTSLTAMVFFLWGVFISRINIATYFHSKVSILGGVVVCGGILYLVFNQNHAANDSYWKIHLINHLNLGDYVMFYLISAVGIGFAMFVSMLVGANSLILYYGENTLYLLGLNGILCHFLHHALAVPVLALDAKIGFVSTMCVVFILTVAELAICYPFIGLVKKSITFFRGIELPFLNNNTIHI